MANPKGRPRLEGSAKNVRLRSPVYELWMARKAALGFKTKTNSEFAEFLLQQQQPTDQQNSRNFMTSTPMMTKRRRLDLSAIPESNEETSHLDVTGTSSIKTVQTATSRANSRDVDVTGTSSIQTILEANSRVVSGSRHDATGNGQISLSAGISGNPYSVLEPVESSDSELDSDDEAEFQSRMDTIIEELNHSDDSDGQDESEISDISDDELHVTLTEVQDQNELTLTAIEGDYSNINEPYAEFEYPDKETDASDDNEPHVEVEIVEPDDRETVATPEKKFEDVFKEGLNTLTSTKSLENMVSLHTKSRVIVSIDKLVELCGSKCQQIDDIGKLCNAIQTHATKVLGSRVTISWKCVNGHCGQWESSEVLCRNKNQNVYLNDCMLCIAIVLSGNNYSKFELLAKAMNLKILSKSSFLNFQRNCSVPVVQDVWAKMKDVISKLIKDNKDLCICGDGRNDSPGHSARYCVYSIMDHASKAVVDVEVLDKRECSGNSTIMEREALRRVLERLKNKLPIKELCTDASSTVIKMVREMKEKNPLLKQMFHSLDVWHKAKKLSKSLHKAAKVKGCNDLKAWVEPVVNHFWHCCQISSGDVEKLKETWFGLLHHVCGEHTWAESSCSHGPETDANQNAKYLAKSSKAMEALRKIVLEPKWLNTLHFYVTFRHTGELESFNNLMTKYVPKRIAFEYPYFIMRVLLAAIDHNMHLYRQAKPSQQGQVLAHRKYSKRTKRFHAEVVKEEKDYRYFKYLSARMLKTRSDYEGSFSAKSDIDEFNPKQIFPTIGMVAAPPTEELLKGPSRFKSKGQVSDDNQQKDSVNKDVQDKTALAVSENQAHE